MEKKCKYCKEVFKDIAGKVFSNHVRWCSKNPNRNNTENIIKATNDAYNRKLGNIKNYLVTCNKCQKEFEVEEREKSFKKATKKFVFYAFLGLFSNLALNYGRKNLKNYLNLPQLAKEPYV